MGHNKHSQAKLETYINHCYNEAVSRGVYTEQDGDVQQFAEDFGSLLRASLLDGWDPEAFVRAFV